MSPGSRKPKTVYDAFMEIVSLKRLPRFSSGVARRAGRKPAASARRASAATVPGAWLTTAFWLTLIFVVVVRLWRLDSLQSEMYGDISTVYQYVLDVKNGVWPFYFALSAGPLYHYLIMPVIWIAGLSYHGLKVASVLASLATLAFTYLAARRLAGAAFAVVAAFIAGISCWLLIFSRLGNFPIIVPLLTMAALWLLVRYVQDRNRWDLYACAAVCALGLYAYPQAYLLGPAVALTLLALYPGGFRMHRREWFTFFAIFILCALPFVSMVIEDPVVFTSGYLGAKIQVEGSVASALLGNLLRAFGAYHLAGDPIFRSNPLERPHLDFLSGLLFLAGLVYWLRRPRRSLGLLLVLPFVLLHIPSILAISDLGEVPSATRTLGVAPIASILVAGGLWANFQFIRERWSHRAAWAVSAVILVLIAGVNARSYFVDYISNLPYHNTPIARMITDYADMLPPETQVYLSGCCWESGMPEPLSIEYEMAHPGNFRRIEADKLSCSTVDSLFGPAVIIWSFREPLPSPNLAACAERFPAQLFSSQAGLPAFHAATIQGLQNRAPIESDEPEDEERLTADGLLEQGVAWGAETVLARYSPLDIGRIEDVVDGRFETLMRGRSANPVVIEFEFSQPRTLTQVAVTTGTMDHYSVRVVLIYSDGSTAEIAEEYTHLPPDPRVEIPLPGTELQVQVIRIEITDLGLQPEDGFHTHVREIELE